MEAIDTVLSPEQRKSYWVVARNRANQLQKGTEGNFKQEDITAIYDDAEMAMCEAQAELTWPIAFEEGRQAGIQEVVEGITKYYEKEK